MSRKPYRRSRQPEEEKFEIPPLLKTLFQIDLDENALQRVRKTPDVEQLRNLLHNTNALFEEGVTKSNYKEYFHHLLWWEETQEKLNLMKYNMPNVKLEQKVTGFILEVPGVAEKRPSLLPGDMIFIQPVSNQNITYSCAITRINGNDVHLKDLDRKLEYDHTPATKYVARFMSSRASVLYPHKAIERLFTSNQDSRVFPVREDKVVVPNIDKFYNPVILTNKEQRRAVEHIVAGSSGKAPYILFGPPGTGKTMTIVEAIVQIVASNPSNRVMVCTNSNMAADHIALTLLKYKETLNCRNFIFRSNSDSRDWNTMPKELIPISNNSEQLKEDPIDDFFDDLFGKNTKETQQSMIFSRAAEARILITTLMHAAKYGFPRNQSARTLRISHLFIDEAAQAAEPHCLIPITGLLSPTGQLVLAGDPQQLGPVCMSKEASKRGLGTSLLERLVVEHADLYEDDPSYMTMLVKNFRSDGDILKLPNQLFYKDELIAMAPPDPISKVSVLGLPGGDRATVFHSVYSMEQKMGNTPSYYNEEELEMLKRYVRALVIVHKVAPEEIGIIAPYSRQVHNIKAWLGKVKIEVGTVESFQGKEKRVILVSTVRTDALGFLVDEKRFNVTLTRAKAKIIIVGNRSCLTDDTMWKLYIAQCVKLNCYYNRTVDELPRTEQLLTKVTKPKTEETKAKTVVTRTKTVVTNPKTEVAKTKTEVTKTKTEVAKTKTEVTKTKTEVTQTKRDIDDLSAALEEKCVMKN